MESIEPYNLLNPAFQADPYAAYRAYRGARPIHFGPPVLPGESRTLYLFRHEDVKEGLANPQLVSSGNPKYMSEGVRRMLARLPEQRRVFHDLIEQWLLFLDPPEHSHLRKSVAGLFTMKRAEQMEVRVRKTAGELISRLVGKGEVDLHQEFNLPFPVLMNCHLLGVPEADWARLEKWGAALMAAKDLSPAPEKMRRAGLAAAASSAYFSAVLERKGAAPGDDLATHLAGLVESGEMSSSQAIAMCVFLMVAAHETVTTFLGNALAGLLAHPAALAAVAGWGESLPEAAIEELLRYGPPVLFVFRRAAEALAIGGVEVPRRTMVGFLLGSANRDPEVFERPEELELSRSPNPHLSFGRGIHFCLGALMVRFQSRIILPLLAAVLEGAAPDRIQIRRNSSHGFEALRVAFR
ncbi:MAG: Cytochrome P450 107B1 [Verrucomicrobia subdivision 3 bacterium]|nr:Cytochrome P450 107B1 [Limisphaerales bacterium]MCS1417594.1 Cytochrome P450 107B1 [Limisphaerales bacterium]